MTVEEFLDWLRTYNPETTPARDPRSVIQEKLNEINDELSLSDEALIDAAIAEWTPEQAERNREAEQARDDADDSPSSEDLARAAEELDSPELAAGAEELAATEAANEFTNVLAEAGIPTLWAQQQGNMPLEQLQATADHVLDVYNQANDTSYATLQEIEDDPNAPNGGLRDPILEQAAAQYVHVEEAEPGFQPSYTIKGPRRSVTLTAVEYSGHLQNSGLDEGRFAAAVWLADKNNLIADDGYSVDVGSAIFLARPLGLQISGDTLEVRQALEKRQSGIQQEIRELTEQMNQGIPGYAGQTIRKQVQVLQVQLEETIAELKVATPSIDFKPGAFEQPELPGGQKINTSTVAARTFSEAAQLFEEAKNLFPLQPELQYLYAQDQELAFRLHQYGEQGLEPDEVPREDYVEAGRLLAEIFPETALEDAARTSVAGAELFGLGVGNRGQSLVDRLMVDVYESTTAGDDSDSDRVRLAPDRVAIEEAARRKFQELYPQGVDGEAVRGMVDRIMADEAATSTERVAFNVDARIDQMLRELPLYDVYYGNKPGSVSEGEYSAAMRSSATSILGAADGALSGASVAGMKAGDSQTAAGAAAFSNLALNNSKWLQNLAQAGQVIARRT